MSHATIPDREFITLFEELGPKKLSERLDHNVRTIYRRRERVEQRNNITIKAPNEEKGFPKINVNHPARVNIAIENGTILVGSDSHYWPDLISTSHRAFVKLCKTLKPKCVVKNGDELDGSTISRFPPIGWESLPTLEEEVVTVKKRLKEIEKAAPDDASLVWPLGNHDLRFESRLSKVAPEFAKIHGMHLKDHFPNWLPCWSAWVNDDLIIKHRFKGGQHSAYNNSLFSGKSICTGHYHRLLARPVADYNKKLRWGIECGTLADPNGPQFRDYSEDNPKDHHQGFAVLTFEDGNLLPPELVYVLEENKVSFRGKILEV